MSRVAEALELSDADARPGPALDDDDHPWGADLAPPSDLRTPLRASHAPAPRPHPPVSRFARGTVHRRPIPSPQVGDIARVHLAPLVERVFLPVSGEPPRAVAFVGVGAPSHAITATTAELLATVDAVRVCIVDANFTAPSLHERFGVANDGGLTGAVKGETPLAESALPVGSNLWLLTAGAGHPDRPSLASYAVRLGMAQFIARFDYVLLDLEPLAGAADAGALAPLVDGVILVVSADETRREAARHAARVLRGAGASVIGAVLTNRRFPIPGPPYRRV